MECPTLQTESQSTLPLSFIKKWACPYSFKEIIKAGLGKLLELLRTGKQRKINARRRQRRQVENIPTWNAGRVHQQIRTNNLRTEGSDVKS